MRMLGMTTKKRSPNDQRSDSFNPGSAEYKAKVANQVKQKKKSA